MSTYFVGPGGDNGNNGTSWANRKLTLNGAEDIPVSAGDTVYVGPGVYRETLTVDVSGSSGSPITYIGDVTGEHTDGIGGIVRITGSDNDQTAARDKIIYALEKAYRTFSGFSFDTSSDYAIGLSTSATNYIIENCSFHSIVSSGVLVIGATQSNIIVKNCVFIGCGRGVQLYHTADVSNCSHQVSNCLMVGCSYGVRVYNIGGVTIKNCTIIGSVTYGVAIDASPASGQKVYVYNSIIYGNDGGLRSAGAGYLEDDYCCVSNNVSDRSNVTAGGNSNAYSPLFDKPIIGDGISYPWLPFALSKWSQIAHIAGTGEPTDDIYGITRPTTSAKKSWGAVQYIPTSRTTGVKYAGSASLKLPDAGAHQMFVPSANQTTSVSIQCYIEGNYNGTQPQIIIKQPGQSDRTNTRTGSTSAWVEITDSFTPAAAPPYFVVEMRSNNNTSVGSYATYFDDFTVS